MDVTALLRAEGVSKVFGRRPGEAVRRLRQGATRDEVRTWGTAAVIDASFEVAAGETFVVMGLSGSGKSTLIRMLNGLWRPTEGRIVLGDDDLAQVDARRLRELRRSRVSMVFQHFALLPHRTVLDNAAYPLQVQGVARDERRQRAGEALEMVGLSGWADSLPSQLSGGMRQRVGLARALAAGTDVLLMDEAFSALDPLIRREMQDQLLELQQTLGKTVVFITHDLNEAMYLGDRIAVMRDGRIVQVGTGEEVLSAPADDYVAQFVADVDRSRVLTASSVMRNPAVTVQVTAGPRQVLRTLREHQVPAAYVVDRRRVLQGLVRDAGVVESLRQGAAALTDAVERDVATVGPGTALADVFAPAAQSALPVPVVDDGGRLVGVVPRATLLEAMTPLDVTVEDELPHTPPQGSPLPGDAPPATTPTDRPTDAEVLA
ncbi:glycine betaine/proline transport system ATP-binding protein [Cellulomonas sp. SLBN-39]|nr:glycine betaine/L-proline ABC transporter ATP-binding protein [Cellulomonas sp. SLBN-39]TQL03701.1 glycine betaine/proline transport system ATP-binding protein [Cellulomonas sp. SLBN-39]